MCHFFLSNMLALCFNPFYDMLLDDPSSYLISFICIVVFWGFHFLYFIQDLLAMTSICNQQYVFFFFFFLGRYTIFNL